MVSEILRYIVILAFPRVFINSFKKGRKGVVITMTTLPSRIKSIGPTIASLCHQTTAPEKIVINLPLESKREHRGYDIPDFLARNDRIEINRIREDHGPATKLLPSLKKFSNEKVKLIVADDDEVYGKKVIENYLSHSQLAKSAVLTLVGWDAPPDNNHHSRIVKFGAIGNKPKNSVEVQSPTQVDCVQGASTFMVSPSFFTEKVFDYQEVPKEAFFVDDIHISGHLASQKIPIYVIPANFRYARIKILKNLISKRSLHKKENSSGHNNNIVYQFYEKYWPSKNERNTA